MKLTSQSFTDGARIPGEFAFCIPAAEGHVCLGGNRNPQLAWSDVPEGTRSFALVCVDPDAPTVADALARYRAGQLAEATAANVESHWA